MFGNESFEIKKQLVEQGEAIHRLEKELANCKMKLSTLEGLSGFSIYPDHIPVFLLTTYIEQYPKTPIKEVVTAILDHLNLYMKCEPAREATVILEKKKTK